MFELIDNANVKVTKSYDSTGHAQANIIINDRYDHSFDPSSRVSRHLMVMTPERLEKRLSGGSFFVLNDSLIDFRYNDYDGFKHDDTSIRNLIDTIGYSTSTDTNGEEKFSLQTRYKSFGIDIAEHGAGGEYDLSLKYSWSPFHRNINAAFETMRLICENGMMARTSLIENKVPLINQWENHLDIAARVLENQFSSLVKERLKWLANERASIAQCLLLKKHAEQRLKELNEIGLTDERLTNIIELTNVEERLSQFYHQSIFAQKGINSQLPSDLTGLDLYNMSTEVRSHTNESTKSTNSALDTFGSTMLFDYKGVDISRLTSNKASNVFADHSRAFYGELAA